MDRGAKISRRRNGENETDLLFVSDLLLNFLSLLRMAAQLFNRLGQLGLGLAVGGAVVNNALYNVDGGHRAVIFDRFTGVKPDVVGEGTHFMVILFCLQHENLQDYYIVT